MPLDVKPLSPARRATMVATMIVLLAASLGFAQLLVRRQQRHQSTSALFPLPPGAKPPMQVYSDLRSVQESLLYAQAGKIKLLASSRVGTGIDARRYTFFSLADIGRKTEEEYLLLLFAGLTLNPHIEGLPPTVESTLGGEPALQTERVVSLSDLWGHNTQESEPEDMPSAFAIMRLAIVDDQVIAVGFSGAGRPSVADRQSFDDYCKSVHVSD